MTHRVLRWVSLFKITMSKNSAYKQTKNIFRSNFLLIYHITFLRILKCICFLSVAQPWEREEPQSVRRRKVDAGGLKMRSKDDRAQEKGEKGLCRISIRTQRWSRTRSLQSLENFDVHHQYLSFQDISSLICHHSTDIPITPRQNPNAVFFFIVLYRHALIYVRDKILHFPWRFIQSFIPQRLLNFVWSSHSLYFPSLVPLFFIYFLLSWMFVRES